MRIALLAPLYESVPPQLYGGTERVVAHLAEGLTERGFEVTLFASGDSQIDCERVAVVPQALRLGSRLVQDTTPYHLRMLSLVKERAKRFDLIHNHHDYWMLPLSEMCSTPLLSTLHGRLDLPDIPAAFQSFPRCSYVSISHSQRRAMPELNWADTIHHGIPIESFHYHSEPGKYLAFLGRITVEKRPEWAIEIARRAGIPLKIAAKIEGAESQAYFDQRIKPHVDGRFIEYVGEISDAEKSEFLGNALALVFPIDWPEPFGLVVIEALACGTPVLARPLGAMPELLRDGVTGYSSLELDALAQRARDLAQLDRSACREWAATHFNLNRMIEDTIDVYRKLAGRQRGPARRRRNLLHSLARPADRHPQVLD